MAATDVYARILSLVSELTGEPAPDATAGRATRLKEDLGLDSIELVQLVLRLNADFGLRIASSAIVPAHFGSLGQLADFIAKEREHGTGTAG